MRFAQIHPFFSYTATCFQLKASTWTHEHLKVYWLSSVDSVRPHLIRNRYRLRACRPTHTRYIHTIKFTSTTRSWPYMACDLSKEWSYFLPASHCGKPRGCIRELPSNDAGSNDGAKSTEDISVMTLDQFRVRLLGLTEVTTITHIRVTNRMII